METLKSRFSGEAVLHIFMIIIIFIICGINLGKLNSIDLLNDEFGYWSHAVSWAGYDWKELIRETPYYAWGYSIWLVPIAAFLPTPELWYKAAIILNIGFLIGAYFLCYFTGRKLFPAQSKILLGLTSMVVIIYPSNVVNAQLTWSETLLSLLTWAITYLIVSLDGKFSAPKFVLASVLLAYSYAVHNRNIGLIACGCLFLLLILLKHRKNWGYFLLLIFVMIAGYRLIDEVKSIQISNLWENSSASDLNNISLNSETVSSYISRIAQKLKLIIVSMGGKLIYLLLGTGMSLGIAVLSNLKETVSNLKSRKLFDSLLISKWWCVFCIVSQWMICSIQMYQWDQRKDVIVYGRYMENAIGPILLLGILGVMQGGETVRKCLVVEAALTFCGLVPVCFLINNASRWISAPCSPVVGGFYILAKGEMFILTLMLNVAVLVMFLLLYFLSYKKSRVRESIILLAFFLLFMVVGQQASLQGLRTRERMGEAIETLKEKVSGEFVSGEIYYIKNEELDSTCINPKYFQYVIPDRTIHVIEPEEVEIILYDENLILIDWNDEENIKLLSGQNDVRLVTETVLLNLYVSN